MPGILQTKTMQTNLINININYTNCEFSKIIGLIKMVIVYFQLMITIVKMPNYATFKEMYF